MVYKTLFIEKKKILITGAAGFIGANLVRGLVNKNHEVYALIRKTNPWRINDLLVSGVVKGCYTDLTNLEDLKKCIQNIKPDFIFHTAVYGAYPGKQKNIKLMIQTNIIGTINLIEAAEEIPIINTGSTSEYGIKESPMKETDLCLPDNDYGWSKLSQTLYCQMKKIPTLRLFSTYGPWEDPNRLIPILIKAKINKLSLNLINSVRDYVYVEDIVDAFIKASEEYDKIKGEIINIGSGKQNSVKDILSIVDNINPQRLKINWNFKAIQTEPKLWVADIEKANKLINWKPTYSVEQGLKKTYGWLDKFIKNENRVSTEKECRNKEENNRLS